MTYLCLERSERNGEKHGVKLEEYEAEFRKRTGIKRKVSNGELIDNMPVLKREFAKAVGELLVEHQSMVAKTCI